MTSPAVLSPAQLNEIAYNLVAFPADLALRQIELHRTNGDFDPQSCDTLAARIRRHADGTHLILAP